MFNKPSPLALAIVRGLNSLTKLERPVAGYNDYVHVGGGLYAHLDPGYYVSVGQLVDGSIKVVARLKSKTDQRAVERATNAMLARLLLSEPT